MGVDQMHYVMIGCNFKTRNNFFEIPGVKEKYLDKYKYYNDINWDKLKDDMEKLDFEVIYDGMNNEYFIIGKVLAVSSWDTGDFDEVIEFDYLDYLINDVTQAFNNTPFSDYSAKLYIFTHYC